MLEPHEKVVFDGMVTRLRSEDPAFSRRIERLGRPRRRLRVATAVLLWTLAPICVVFGGWTGLIMAIIAAVYGSALMTSRRARADGMPRLPRRHPGLSN